eukprot:4720803-Ditylum_brightwellii.AAC.1
MFKILAIDNSGSSKVANQSVHDFPSSSSKISYVSVPATYIPQWAKNLFIHMQIGTTVTMCNGADLSLPSSAH